MVRGPFSLSPASPQSKEAVMQNTELAFAKNGLLTTRDWDTFQAILRKCLRVRKPVRKQSPKNKS